MIVTFTYPLPDDLYIEGVSGEKIGTYTYDGPETILVKNGFVVFDPEILSDAEMKDVIEIDASANPEVAYFFANYFKDDAGEWVYEFEDITMDNGDIYKNPLNPNLTDAYQCEYDLASSSWKITQVIKELGHPLSAKVKQNYDKIKRYYDAYEFSPECESAMERYLSNCESYLEQYKNFASWKYINFNLKDSPKMPTIIINEIASIPDPLQEENNKIQAISEISTGVI